MDDPDGAMPQGDDVGGGEVPQGPEGFDPQMGDAGGEMEPDVNMDMNDPNMQQPDYQVS